MYKYILCQSFQYTAVDNIHIDLIQVHDREMHNGRVVNTFLTFSLLMCYLTNSTC